MVGTVLQKMRLKARMTQEELALRAKVDRSYISLLEHNKKSPTLEMLFRLSNAMGVKASSIVAKVEQIQKTSV